MNEEELQDLRAEMNAEFTAVCVEDGWDHAMDMLRLEVNEAMEHFTDQPSQAAVAFVALAVEIMANSIEESTFTLQ